MIRIFIVLAILSITATTSAQQAVSTLEENMTGQEFRDTGLHKLNEQELAALNLWLRANSLGKFLNQTSAAQPDNISRDSTDDMRGFDRKKDDDDREVIHSTIMGPFSGWDGTTVFRLSNGMIWEQAEKDTFFVNEESNPTVTIKPKMFGKWKLKVDGHKKSVKVKRIQ